MARARTYFHARHFDKALELAPNATYALANAALANAQQRDPNVDVDRLVVARAVVDEARRIVGDGPTYISFDVDGLDPVYAPSTGTPEAGGITMVEAQRLLRLEKGHIIVGQDSRLYFINFSAVGTLNRSKRQGPPAALPCAGARPRCRGRARLPSPSPWGRRLAESDAGRDQASSSSAAMRYTAGVKG